MDIKRVIKANGLTVKEVAERMGITSVGLSQHINGNPSVEVLERIAAAVGGFLCPSADEHDHLPALRQTYQSGERGIKITPGLRAYTNVRKSAFYLRVLL